MRRALGALLMAVVLVSFLGSFPACSWGDSGQTLENSSPQEIVDAMANKAVRGVANVTTGWLEFPKQIYLTYKEDGVAKGVVVGPLKGMGMTLVRTASGFCEAVTFFLAFPGFYDPYVEPAYVWQKE